MYHLVLCLYYNSIKKFCAPNDHMSANSAGEIFALFCKNRSSRICQLDVCVRKNVCIFHCYWCL